MKELALNLNMEEIIMYGEICLLSYAQNGLKQTKKTFMDDGGLSMVLKVIT